MDPQDDAVTGVASDGLGERTEVPDLAADDNGSMLMWVGSFSGGLVFVVILVLIALRLRPTPTPTFEEPEEEVIPEDHRAPPPQVLEEVPPAEGLAGALRRALGRSRAALQGRFDTLFGRNQVDEQLFEDLEEALLAADVGVHTTDSILADLRARSRGAEGDATALREALRGAIRDRLAGVARPLVRPEGVSPWVILVVGVNGSGKTTTIGKLAARFKGQGLQVMLAAGDTFRAAASEQLDVWSQRAGVDIVKGEPGTDPGAVVYDALTAATARGHDVVLIDTAGRLQTEKPLMEQLTKIRRVIAKVCESGPHETLLVLDGTMGQNGLSQARLFHEATPLTGVAVTKLDGTAKGGMVLTLAAEMDLPICLIGIGEQLDDLKDFDADAFVEVLA
jgi:fused signal recognition particle receptor